MKTEQFLKDLEGLKQTDFDYGCAYTHRDTGEWANIYEHAGVPLEEVLKTCKVCVSGYFMSLIKSKDTRGIQYEYDFSENQLDAIIYPESEITFENGVKLIAPYRDSNLSEVKAWINYLFSLEEYMNDEIESVTDTIGF